MYNLKDFINEFKKYDSDRVWKLKEIKLLYAELMKTYGDINDENFDIIYCIKNKESINF